jgi:acetyltransferase-like isoleucine patch superfamily enzyme
MQTSITQSLNRRYIRGRKLTTRIWDCVQVREGACVGRNCTIGKGTYIGVDVLIGDNVKIQNACHVYRGATLEDRVFLGPGVILVNPKHPRAISCGTWRARPGGPAAHIWSS